MTKFIILKILSIHSEMIEKITHFFRKIWKKMKPFDFSTPTTCVVKSSLGQIHRLLRKPPRPSLKRFEPRVQRQKSRHSRGWKRFDAQFVPTATGFQVHVSVHAWKHKTDSNESIKMKKILNTRHARHDISLRRWVISLTWFSICLWMKIKNP